MSDPIQAVQAMAGCPHRWETDYEYRVLGGWRGSRMASRKCTRCRKRIKKHGKLPAPAPDCSTTDGMMRAVRLILPSYRVEVAMYLSVGIELFSEGTLRHFVEMSINSTDEQIAKAGCTLILEALDNN